MAATSPVALILGAGPRVGLPAAKAFALRGYKVAVAARSLSEADSTETQLNIKADFSRPEDVVNAFAKVKQELGIPSVVLYNGRFPPSALAVGDVLENILLTTAHSGCRHILSPRRTFRNVTGGVPTRYDGQ